MVTLSFTIFSGQKNYNRAHMLFQVLCGLEPIFYTTHPNEEPKNFLIYYWVYEENFKVQVIAVIYNRRDQLRALMNMDYKSE